MRKLISGLLILCASALFAQMGPSESIDAKFVALSQWSEELTASATTFNKLCDKDPDMEGRPEIRAVLTEQFKYFIMCALRYSSIGDDCRAKLRERVVAHSVRQFTWNINCVGVKMGKDDAASCEKEMTAFKQESEQLQKEIDTCTKEIKNKNLKVSK
jgi:hypothetical protein